MYRLADEKGPLVLRRKRAALINGDATGRREMTDLRVVYVQRIVGDWIDGGRVLMIGQRLHRRVHGQVAIARQVLIRKDDVADVIVVPHRKATAPGVEGIAELGIAGDRLQLTGVGPEAKVHALAEN